MLIQRSETFAGLSASTMAQITRFMSERAYRQGETVYTPDDPAGDFYILVEGSVRLRIGSEAELAYNVNRPGELFGWAGMVERPFYAACAECTTPTRLLRAQKQGILEVLEKDPASGMRFFQNLAAAIYQRLLYSHDAFIEESMADTRSIGTGQLQALGEE